MLLHQLEVECLPKDIPDVVEIDIENLAVGDSIHLSDITPPENVKFLAADDTVMVTVTVPKAIIEEEEEVEEGLEEGLEEGEEGEGTGEEGAEEAEAEEE